MRGKLSYKKRKNFGVNPTIGMKRKRQYVKDGYSTDKFSSSSYENLQGMIEPLQKSDNALHVKLRREKKNVTSKLMKESNRITHKQNDSGSAAGSSSEPASDPLPPSLFTERAVNSDATYNTPNLEEQQMAPMLPTFSIMANSNKKLKRVLKHLQYNSVSPEISKNKAKSDDKIVNIVN